MILVLSACGGLFRYCYDSNSYVVLHSCKDDYYPTKGSADEDKGLSSVSIMPLLVLTLGLFGRAQRPAALFGILYAPCGPF